MPTRSSVIRIGLPKGRFLGKSLSVLEDIGCNIERPRTSSWTVSWKGLGIAIKTLKIQDIAKLLQTRDLDWGVCSDEWIAECGLQLRPIVDLDWCLTRVVFAVSQAVSSKQRGDRLTIATPYPNLTRNYFAKKALPCRIIAVAGGTEALAPDICDGVVDCMETGQTLNDNGLTVQDVILDSSVRLFAGNSLHCPAVNEICQLFERHRKFTASIVSQ